MRVKPLIAGGIVCAVSAPALAYSQAAPAARIAASDKPTFAWAPAAVTVTTGQTVTFESKGNAQPHFVAFTDGPAKPDCSGVPMTFPRSAEWSGTCTFPAAGDYAFNCPLHKDTAGMTGTVHVVAPTPTATATPDATETPGATATASPAYPDASATP